MNAVDPRHRTVNVLQIRKFGNSSGVLLPADLVARLGLKVGDEFHVIEHPDGGFRLTPENPSFARSMAMVDEIMDEYRDTLRELAK